MGNVVWKCEKRPTFRLQFINFKWWIFFDILFVSFFHLFENRFIKSIKSNHFGEKSIEVSLKDCLHCKQSSVQRNVQSFDLTFVYVLSTKHLFSKLHFLLSRFFFLFKRVFYADLLFKSYKKYYVHGCVCWMQNRIGRKSLKLRTATFFFKTFIVVSMKFQRFMHFLCEKRFKKKSQIQIISWKNVKCRKLRWFIGKT